MGSHGTARGRAAAVVVSALLLVGSAPLAHAVPLLPGDTVPLPGTTSSETPALDGPVRDERLSPFQLVDDAGNVILSGAIQLTVRGVGPLTTEYQVVAFDDGGRGFRIVELTSSSVSGYCCGLPPSADFRLDAGGDVAPETAFWSWFSGVQFNFSQGIGGGAQSKVVFVTAPDDLFEFGSGHGASVLVQDSAGEQHALPFDAYAVFIPEPSTALLLASGLLGLSGARRKARPRPSVSPRIASADAA